MKKVCVITGGGSGMGLAAAKFMSNEKIIVLSGRTVSKLEKAVNDLHMPSLRILSFGTQRNVKRNMEQRVYVSVR
jgi:short-subunit dehydrogenase